MKISNVFGKLKRMSVDGLVIENREVTKPKVERSSPKETRFLEKPGEYEAARKDNNILRMVLFKNLAHEYQRVGVEIPENVSEIPIHIGQVALVAKVIVLFSNLSKEDKADLLVEAERFGLTHDFGRIGDVIDLTGISGESYQPDNHSVAGVDWLTHMGFDGRYKKFALAHHMMGQGHESMQERIADVIKKEGVLAAVQKIDADFGIVGLAGILADLSKAYVEENGIRSETPTIAEFNPDAHQKLVDRQVDKKLFGKDSDKYKTEMQGRELLMGIIGFLEYKYNVNYPRAIVYAKQWWNNGIPGDDPEEAEIDKFQRDWKNAREIVLGDSITTYRPHEVVELVAD